MYSFGVIMDPIENINPTEDSTFAIINALQQKCNIEYIIPDTIHIINQEVFAKIRRLHTYKRKNKFFTLSKSKLINLSRLNCILFRKDPPVDEKYIHITHMLDFLELSGVLIINSPQSIRDFNEKLLGNNLTNHNIPTLVSSDRNIIKGFIKKNKDVVMKPLNLMGGKDIVRLSFKDTELFKKIDNMTMFSKRIIMVQKFLNQVKKGDTRILITNGIVHEKVLVRYPPKNDFRANLSHGGIFKIKQINPNHLKHLEDIAVFLKNNRIYFAGVDMIGDYITEINITSPTGIQQIEQKDRGLSLKISKEFIKLVDQYYDGK
jgi:glutathione synthase